jgi:hypothetical protein
MTNQEIADRIYNSYFDITGVENKNEAKEHANALIDVQIQLMFQDEGNVIIEEKRDLYLDDWEEIKYIINTK